MIFDTSDLFWKDVFTKEELREIRTHRAPVLPSIDEDVQDCLTSFNQDSYKKPKDLYNHAFSCQFVFGTSFTKRWKYSIFEFKKCRMEMVNVNVILYKYVFAFQYYKDVFAFIQKSSIKVAEVFESTERIKLDNFSEGDLFNKIWQFVYKGFKDSPIEAKLGEIISTASSIGRNEHRGLEGVGKRERKVTGAKVDILFQAGRYEVGCCEVGKEDVLPIDDIYLDDGTIKLPKTLRDMLSRTMEVNPVKINSLYTVGMLMMGLELEVLIVDIPAGQNITRISRTKRLSFPDRGSTIAVNLTSLLETALIAMLTVPLGRKGTRGYTREKAD